MASHNGIKRASTAALALCIYTQISLSAVLAQSSPPVDPNGSTPPLVPGTPPPSVPSLDTAITPEVLATLAQPSAQAVTVIDFGQLSGGTLNVGEFVNPANSTVYAISSNASVQTAVAEL